MSLPENFAVRPTTMDDLEAILALYNACSVEQVGKAVVDETELQMEWKMPTFDLGTDTRVVLAPDGTLVGHVAVWDGAPHVRLWADVRVHPEYKGRSIGTCLGQWAEERARRAIPKAPEGARVVLRRGAFSTNTAAQTLLCQQDYQIVRHFLNMAIEMDGPPPEPVVPEGIVIRPFVREREARALVVATRESFRDHWGYVERPFEEEHAEWVMWMDDDPSFDASLWFVAVDGKEITGLSLCYSVVAEDPNMAEVATLGVRRPWRRWGIALALLHHSFGELYRRDKSAVTLGVDAQSLTGAARLYEKAGMYVRHRSVCYEKELRSGEDLTTQSVGD